MKYIVPAYYSAFCCIADRCQHTCCVGWEIDIDEDTAAFYKTVDGTLGNRLAATICETDGICSFVLTDGERCPFLNDRNLCDIITALGEQALCQICADHPRFRNFFSDHVEIGLGLSCEEAARVILTSDSDTLTVWDDDGEDDTPTDDETAFLSQRDELFAIARDRTLRIREREEVILSRVGCAALSGEDLFARFEPLERLEDDWSDTLSGLHCAPDTDPPQELQVPFERLLVYFLFRHLPDALDDGRFCERAAFAAYSVRLLRMLCAANGNTLDALTELARRFSGEIEYSDENMDILLASF